MAKTTEAQRDAMKIYGIKNKLKIRARKKAYRLANKEKVAQQKRESYERHREKAIASTKAYQRRHYDKRISRNVDSNRSRKLGVTPIHVNGMLDRQGFRCVICGHPEGTGKGMTHHVKRLALDHCHRTGAIRGMLCGHCNQGLGHFKDSLGLLRNAQQYLLDNYPNLELQKGRHANAPKTLLESISRQTRA